MRRTVPIILTLTLALAGCAAADEGDDADDQVGTPSATSEPSPDDPSPTVDDEPSASPSPSSDDAVASMQFEDCTTARFTIGHPASWSVNTPGGPVDECRVFHPDAIDLPDDPREIGLQWAATIFIDDVPFADVAGQSTSGQLLEERSTSVDGRDAVVTEVRSDGAGLLPEGETQYLYAVDLDGETLFARTTTVGATDYDRDRQVLDRMLTELEVTDIEPIAGPASTEPRAVEHTGAPVTLTDIEAAGFTGFDRVTLAIGGDGEAGWDVAYEADPRSQGSGTPVDIEGDATLRVSLTGVALPPDAPVESYDGPERLQPASTDAVLEILDDTVFEGRHELFVGIDRDRPFRIARRDGAVILEIALE